MMLFADQDEFEIQEFHGTEFIARQSSQNQWKIVLPEALIP